MNEPTPRFRQIFFEVLESLAQTGPGQPSLCCARRSPCVATCRPSPAVLDLGCGVGGQTLHLAELTSGSIVATGQPCAEHRATARDGR